VSAGAAVRDAAVQKVLKKTVVYQRANELMLHQGDAAKFLLRDGEGDRARVRRLNLRRVFLLPIVGMKKLMALAIAR
jgi:hypothetical protein